MSSCCWSDHFLTPFPPQRNQAWQVPDVLRCCTVICFIKYLIWVYFRQFSHSTVSCLLSDLTSQSKNFFFFMYTISDKSNGNIDKTWIKGECDHVNLFSHLNVNLILKNLTPSPQILLDIHPLCFATAAGTCVIWFFYTQEHHDHLITPIANPPLHKLADR